MRRTYKWVAVILLAVLLVLILSTVVMAADTQPLLNNPDSQKYYEQNKPGYGERFLAGVIIGSVKWMLNLFHLSDPVLMVFNHDPRADTSDKFLTGGVYGALQTDQLVLGIFPKPFFTSVSILYSGFQKLLPIPLVIALLLIAILHMLNSGSVQQRGKLKENLQFVIIAMATVRFGVYIWTAIITLNNFLVNLIWAYMLQSGVKPDFFMNMIWGKGKAGFDAATQMASLPMVILLLLAAMMILTLNYQYTMRIIILGLLIVIFPLAAGLSIFPGFRHSLQMWFKEFVANVILQLAHALALGAFFITLHLPDLSQGVSFWLMITYFAGLPAISVLIREMLGLQQGGGSRAMVGMGAMAGIASVAAMGRMVMRNPASRGIGAGGGMDAGEGIQGGSTGDGKGSGGAMSLGGATSTLGKAGQMAFNGVSAVTGSKAAQGAAKFGLGATAALAGGALSSIISGNAAPGAMLGLGAGSVMGRQGGHIAGKVGGHVQAAAQAVSAGDGMKGIHESVMARSMQSGGMLSSAGWGLQTAVNKVSSLAGHEGPFAAPGFFSENKQMLRTAQSGLREIEPQMEVAHAKYNQTLSHFGPNHEQTKNLHEQYQSLKGMYNTHTADAHLAKTQLRSYEALKQYKAASGGKV